MVAAEKYMQRALDLAKLGLGNVQPNPMVGCVIVHQGLIIGEGWHQQYGQPHAEVNAINSVVNKGLIAESTVYVSLEPCSHYGKTPPCVDLLIKNKVKKVVICNSDPYELVGGRGIEKLKQAGIELEMDILAKKGRWLNRRFFTFVEKKRPYIVLKWAETANGFIAGENGEPLKISNELAQMFNHKFRAEEDVIMVGTNTAAIDNPQLTVRNWVANKNPIRAVIDKNLRLNKQLNIFNKQATTLIFNKIKNEIGGEQEFIKADFSKPIIPAILQQLYEKNVQSLLVEGGTQLINSFIEANSYDEIRVFKSPNSIKSGIKAPTLPKGLQLLKHENLMGNSLSIYKN